MNLLPIAGWIFLAAALAGSVYALIAARALRRLTRAPALVPTNFPDVTLLKPLHGAEPGLAANLETFCRQDYPGKVQIVFGVQDRNDPAIQVVGALKARNPEMDIALVVTAHDGATNPKIANLMAMAPHAKHGTIALSDSDIGVRDDYLRVIAGMLEAPKVGAVTCFYRGEPRGNLWSRLAAMGVDYNFLPNTVFAVGAGLATPCFGSTIAMKMSVLEEIGGFGAFRVPLADDYEMGRAVRARGYRLAYPAMIVSHTFTERNLGAVLRHELRWARTILAIDPKGYAGSVVTHILPLGVLGAGLAGFSGPSLAALSAIAAARLAQKGLIDRALGRPGPPAWLLPLRDMLSMVVFVGAFFVKQVDWRGSRYRVSPAGALAARQEDQ